MHLLAKTFHASVVAVVGFAVHRLPSAMCCADTFHKPGFKMHTKILHHLFLIISTDVIKAPLWDVASLGPTAFPNNAAFVHQHVSQLLTTSFPNLRPQQVEVGFRLSANAFLPAP